jgi:ribosomal protein S18 acetylase RimI-like enzyme
MAGVLGITTQNVIVGLITTFIIGTVVYLKDRLLNFYIEMQYPVAGSYITTFEDEEDGERVTRRAPANISQTGRKIEGKTSLPGDDREWVLEGEISTNGYINGIYRAIDPHDQGIGNFFLYINHDRHMEGTWSGYDEVNRQITSGRYTFVPKFDNFRIRDVSEEDIPPIIDIADQQLGKDYLSAGLLKQSLNEDSPYFTRVAVTEPPSSSSIDKMGSLLGLNNNGVKAESNSSDSSTGRIVGFCLNAVFTPDELDEYLHVDLAELPEAMQAADEIGVIRTIAVKQSYHGRGIGTELVEASIQHCYSISNPVICAIGWKDEGTVSIGGVLERLEFDRIAEYGKYWHEDSLEHDYECQTCGDPPCNCSAVLYARYQ